jgi:hypothetical protein
MGDGVRTEGSMSVVYAQGNQTFAGWAETYWHWKRDQQPSLDGAAVGQAA